MYKLNLIDKISILLIIIGAFNWGIIGLSSFNFDLVKLFSTLFGPASEIIRRIIYIMIGLASTNIGYLIWKNRFVKKYK
jgi:uncharacterized membrane protein YuzA (DUF378 family)